MSILSSGSGTSRWWTGCHYRLLSATRNGNPTQCKQSLAKCSGQMTFHSPENNLKSDHDWWLQIVNLRILSGSYRKLPEQVKPLKYCRISSRRRKDKNWENLLFFCVFRCFSAPSACLSFFNSSTQLHLIFPPCLLMFPLRVTHETKQSDSEKL